MLKTKRYISDALEIAWNNPNSDHRDLKRAAVSELSLKKPNIFSVPKDILKDPRTKLGFSSCQAGMRAATIPYVGVPNAVLPGVLSADPDFDNFKYQLAMELSKSFKPEIDDDGFAGSNAIVKDFSALLTSSGIKSSAANAPPVTRSILMEGKGIASTFTTERHRRIFTALHQFMFKTRTQGAPMSFQVRSSTTMPTHYSGKGSQFQKQLMIHNIGMNLGKIFDLISADDLGSLYKDYNMYFGMKLVERLQAEGAIDFLNGGLSGKDRMVSDMQYALSGGKTGRRYAASKTDITRDVFGLKYGLGSRVRTAYAVSGQINALIGLFLAGNRAHYLKAGGYTWHHTTPDAIYQDIKEFEVVVGMDVTTMDQFFPKFLLEFHAQKMGEYYDPRFGKIIEYVNGLPYYAPQLTYGSSPFWAGDPRSSKTFNVDVGLSSGRTDNPDCGKWYMTGAYLCLVDDVVKDVLEYGRNDYESIEHCLSGKHPMFGIKDMSDDALIGFKTGFGDLGRKLRQNVKEGEDSGQSASPYALLGLETGIAFLGNVILKDDLGQITRPKPNPVTFVVNRFCPERGINTSARQYWAHGLRSAEEHYSRAGSIISDILRIEKDVWRSCMKDYPTPDQMIAHAATQQQLPFGTNLSSIDMEVLLDPSKLYYKFTIEDVSMEIARLFTSSIEGETVDAYIKPFI